MSISKLSPPRKIDPGRIDLAHIDQTTFSQLTVTRFIGARCFQVHWLEVDSAGKPPIEISAERGRDPGAAILLVLPNENVRSSDGPRAYRESELVAIAGV